MMPSTLRLKGEGTSSPKLEPFPSSLPKSLKPKPESLGQQFYKEATSQELSPFEEGLGTTLRGVSSAVLGAPGNLMNLTRQAGHGLADFVANYLGQPQLESPKSFIPGTPEIEKGFDVLTGSKFKPTEEQKPMYELGQDITSMLLPGSTGLKYWQKVAIPIAAQSAKQGVKLFKGTENQQEIAKMGVMLSLSLAGIGNGEKYAKDLMAQSKSLIQPGTQFDSKPFEKGINSLKNSPWYKGADLPYKRPAKALVEAIERNVSAGKIDGQMAIQLREDANQMLGNLGAFEVKGAGNKRNAVRLVNEVKDSIIKGIDQYGKNVDPVFGKAYQEANQAYSVVEQSKKISNFLRDHAPVVKSAALKALLFGGEIAATVLKPSAAGTIAGGTGLYKGYQIMDRIMKSPKLREYYRSVLLNAFKQDAPAVAKSIKKLDAELD
jgi:hypothetical protein